MINDLALRWVVTALFAMAIAEGAYSLVTHRLRWPGVLSHLLHLVMSAAMIAMAWPATMDWPTVAPMVFFIVATLWFAIAATAFAGESAERIAHIYHAVMMAAMAWMYALMSGDLLPGSHSAGGPSAHDTHMGSSSMPGMDMSDGETGGIHTDMTSALPGYAGPINWVLFIGFVLAAAVWLYLYFSRRRLAGDLQERASALLTHSGELSQVFMAVGTAIMFLSIA